MWTAAANVFAHLRLQDTMQLRATPHSVVKFDRISPNKLKITLSLIGNGFKNVEPFEEGVNSS